MLCDIRHKLNKTEKLEENKRIGAIKEHHYVVPKTTKIYPISGTEEPWKTMTQMWR